MSILYCSNRNKSYNNLPNGKNSNFRATSRLFFGGISALLPESWAHFIDGVGITAVGWVFLYMLNKKKIFLPVKGKI